MLNGSLASVERGCPPREAREALDPPERETSLSSPLPGRAASLARSPSMQGSERCRPAGAGLPLSGQLYAPL